MTVNWPSGVTDQTPLPFTLWRILDAVAVRNTSNGIGQALQAGAQAAIRSLPSDAKIQEALVQAEQYANRAQRQEQVLTEQLISEVTTALVTCIGPMGQILVEDAIDSLPEPLRLSAFLRSLALELEDTQRQVFANQLRERGIV